MRDQQIDKVINDRKRRDAMILINKRGNDQLTDGKLQDLHSNDPQSENLRDVRSTKDLHAMIPLEI